MSRETENIFKGIQEFLDKNAKEGMSDEEINALIQEYMTQHNNSIPERITEETAKTADDFVALAEESENDASTLKYAKKALKLDPDNLDAERIVLLFSARDVVDLLRRFEQAIARGNDLMKKWGYDGEDSIGHYWGIWQTRPYMRLRDAYMQNLVQGGMYSRAAEECCDMLHLCEMDNLGTRYTLMHLYAMLEREEEALALMKKFEENQETQLLLPLTVLYYKRRDLTSAEKYLRQMEKTNKDTKKFFKAVAEGNMERVIGQMSPFGYRPFSIEEYIIAMTENEYLYQTAPTFFQWADKTLRKRK